MQLECNETLEVKFLIFDSTKTLPCNVATSLGQRFPWTCLFSSENDLTHFKTPSRFDLFLCRRCRNVAARHSWETEIHSVWHISHNFISHHVFLFFCHRPTQSAENWIYKCNNLVIGSSHSLLLPTSYFGMPPFMKNLCLLVKSKRASVCIEERTLFRKYQGSVHP